MAFQRLSLADRKSLFVLLRPFLPTLTRKRGQRWYTNHHSRTTTRSLVILLGFFFRRKRELSSAQPLWIPLNCLLFGSGAQTAAVAAAAVCSLICIIFQRCCYRCFVEFLSAAPSRKNKSCLDGTFILLVPFLRLFCFVFNPVFFCALFSNALLHFCTLFDVRFWGFYAGLLCAWEVVGLFFFVVVVLPLCCAVLCTPRKAHNDYELARWVEGSWSLKHGHPSGHRMVPPTPHSLLRWPLPLHRNRIRLIIGPSSDPASLSAGWNFSFAIVP